MKCINCGTEFDGVFCPKCGTKCEDTSAQPKTESPYSNQAMQQPSPFASPNIKKKKPFYKRAWFIILVIIILVVFLGRKRNDKSEKIIWKDIVMGETLPEPPKNKGDIIINDDKMLSIKIDNISSSDYSKYIKLCEDKGFTVDSEKNSVSYEAFNQGGYKLRLSFFDGKKSEMAVSLEAPMEMKEIKWPSGTAGSLIPAPKSTTGKFSYEHDESFSMYIGNTSQSDFNDYVKACADNGFTVDYSKDDTYYYANNAEGAHISLTYEGNNTMQIDVSAADKEEQALSTVSDTFTTAETSAADTSETAESTEAKANAVDGMRPDFKEAMDSYEAFIDEYVSFMKKYSESGGNDTALLLDYANYMSKYADAMEKFDKWESEDMNSAESAYYLEVQLRVNQKLLEALS